MNTVLELTENNAIDYLRSRDLDVGAPAQANVLSGGVSNIVLRVSGPKQNLVLKQSCPQLRTKDPWFSNIDRVFREVDAMRILGAGLPLACRDAVPKILDEDRANHTFAMTSAPLDAKVWKPQLLAGEIDQGVGHAAGRLLGEFHALGVRDPHVLKPLQDNTFFFELRLEPYYLRIRRRRPDLAEPLDRLIVQTETARKTLVHADFSPKNILTHGRAITLVDYETVHVGEPAFDLGFFLAHLTLKAILLRADASRFADLVLAPVDGYCSAANVRWEDQFPTVAPHLGANLLVRIDGTSPVEYFNDPNDRQFGRDLAQTLLTRNDWTWREFVESITHRRIG